MRMLITGGTGFIGTHFLAPVLENGWLLTLLDLHPPTQDLPRGVEFIRGDVRDPTAVGRAMDGCEAVLHLAAAHHDFGLTRETYFSVNEEGTRVVCQAMEDRAIDRLCFFSSAAVYGQEGAHNESEEPNPSHSYGESKLAGELVVREWCSRGQDRSCLIMRPTVVLGPGNYANMFKLIRQIDRRLFLPVGTGSNRKSMAFISNVVGATLHAWARHRDGMTIFNYADKPDLTSREIVETIYRCLGREAPRFHVPLATALLLASPFDSLSGLLGKQVPISRQGIRKLAGVTSVFDASRIAESGYRAEVGLQEGILRMVDWYRTKIPGPVEARLAPAEVQFSV